VELCATTSYGALRGLETFAQLVQYDFDRRLYFVQPWCIVDKPRYSFRALLVDSSRHFIPMQIMMRIIESMSFAKLNVLHWHAMDSHSFPIETPSYPDLWKGSWSEHQRYGISDMQQMVHFASLRGIRVMIEIDGPGHAWSWGVGYKDLLPDNYQQRSGSGCQASCPRQPCNVPLDPSKHFTYQVIDGVFSDLLGVNRSGLFFEDFVHLGGDEVDQACWESSAQIQQWMRTEKIPSLTGAYKYFVDKQHELARKRGKVPVAWEEVYAHFTTGLPKQTVIHVWNNRGILGKATNDGFRALLSAGWYLDSQSSWEQMLSNDPDSGLNDAQRKLVIGGGACMWSEQVDASNILMTIWPRTAAVAERLWSSQGQDASFRERFIRFRCLLTSRGIESGTINPSQRGMPHAPNGCGSE